MKRKFSSWLGHLMPREHLHRELAASRSRLYRLAFSWCHNSTLAEDLVHDTVATALERVHQLRDDSRFDVWLTRILLNQYRDHGRRTHPETGWNHEDLGATGDLPVDELMATEIVAQTRRAIGQLSEDHRQVVSLIDLADYSYADTARILGVPQGTVMSRLSRAREHLRELLNDDAAVASDDGRVVPMRKRK